MEGCIDHKTLQHIYESRYHEEIACGKVDKDPDKDDLDELRHLSFDKKKGKGILWVDLST